jgi:hypothetical protein
MAEVKCLKCSKVCKSLQGWKQHMSGAHGGYDDADLQAVAGGGVSTAPDDVRARMNRFADSLPDLGGGTGGDVASGQDGAPTVSPPPPAPEGKRIKATPKRLKKILGDIPSKILEAQGIPLDADDEEAMEEAAEFLAGVFGIEFAVPESKYVVQSRFAALLWVVGVTFLVWIKHKTPEVWAFMAQGKGKADGKSVPANNSGQSGK